MHTLLNGLKENGLKGDLVDFMCMTFSRASTITLAIVYLRFLRTRRANGAAPPRTTPPPCGGWYRAYALLDGPLVVWHFLPLILMPFRLTDIVR
jgi:hypothetical protein